MERHVGPRAILNSFFRLQERPRALQEGSKRFSERFRVGDTIWSHFGPTFSSFSGPQNHEKSYWRLGGNRIFIKSPISFWDPIWDPPGLPFGRGFGPQDCRKRSPGCPWAVQEPIAGPSKLRKTISRAPMGRPRADRRNLLCLQEPSPALQGANWGAKKIHFYGVQDGSILEIDFISQNVPFWSPKWSIL